MLIFPVDLSHSILPSPELDKVDGLVAAAAAAPVLCKVTMLNLPGVCPGPLKGSCVQYLHNVVIVQDV